MLRQYHRNIAELLDSYRDYILSKVSKVQILGEAEERDLRGVFVELSIADRRYPGENDEFLGMVDAVMRRRFNPFLSQAEPLRQPASRQRLKPDELLRPKTKAVVTGAPGCGKTTLLRYLALRAQENESRLVVWLELKAIGKPLFAEAEKIAAHEGHLILPELWLKHLKTQLTLRDAEIKILRLHWQERFKASEIAVFLDGFDELQDDEIERSLNRCVREFASASHDNNLLISTRPYAQQKLGVERLREFEIEPLNQRQIEAFLNCYYPDDLATEDFLKTVRERSSLSELMHVPLLLGIILRLHREKRFASERLELYAEIIADLIHELDRSKSVNRRFKINDERLRLDFLKFVAFEQLLREPSREEEREVNKIVFSYDLLKEKARKFLAQERSRHDARQLADDVLATPLLREVGADTFAFVHLTLQEYLAARAFAAFYQSNEFEGLRIFCRAYYNLTIVEMEVLPMMLGAVTKADKLYGEIEGWPESLNFINLRLRLRGLRYSAKINEQRLGDLADRIIEFFLMTLRGGSTGRDERLYKAIIVDSVLGIDSRAMQVIEAKSEKIIEARDSFYRSEFIEELGKIGSDRAGEILISDMSDFDSSRRFYAVSAARWFGSERMVEALVARLNDYSRDVREMVPYALSRIGSPRAVDALILALGNEVSDVRETATKKLGEIGAVRATDALISRLSDSDSETRWNAAESLGKIGGQRSAAALIQALTHETDYVPSAAQSLGRIGGNQAVDALISALSDERVSRWAAAGLGLVGSERAVKALISALTHEDDLTRRWAAESLGEIGSGPAVEALISVLNQTDFDDDLRAAAAKALGEAGSERAVEALIAALNRETQEGPFNSVLFHTAFALGEMGSERAVDGLIAALNHQNRQVGDLAARGLGANGSERAVAALISALNHKERLVASEAAVVLGEIGSETAIKALAAKLNCGDEERTYDATYALENVSADGVDALIAVLEDKDCVMNKREVSALKKIISSQAAETLIAALDDESLDEKDVAAEKLSALTPRTLIPALIRAFNHPKAFVRRKAALAIGYYSSDREMLDRLVQLAQIDQDAVVRTAAKEAAEEFARKLELLGQVVPVGTPQRLLDSASKEGVLVHEVGAIVSAAGHFFREVLKYDEGIDSEIEFRDEEGRGTGQRVYLQLKSGDSYLTRQKGGKEIFRITKSRHAHYWFTQPSPVVLVIRDSKGRIRWMDVTEYLRRHGTNIKQMEFQGEPFTAESVKEMRFRFAR